MSIYVLVSTHSSNECPTSNAKTRELFTGMAGEMQKIAQATGVKPIVGPLVSTQHRAFSVVEAAKPEAVREFLIKTRLIQWNSIEVIPVISQDEARKELEQFHPIY